MSLTRPHRAGPSSPCALLYILPGCRRCEHAAAQFDALLCALCLPGAVVTPPPESDARRLEIALRLRRPVAVDYGARLARLLAATPYPALVTVNAAGRIAVWEEIIAARDIAHALVALR